MTENQTRVWEEEVLLPTYGTGEPNKNPMFLEKRVYQGSSGKVYPYPVIDKILDEKRLQAYHLVFLENDYLHIALMPEIGGRIYRALDKTNGYDFIYYNHVIKPALVGLAGPWISGGVEFNWPQHHRPNTFGPVEHTITHQSDGSKTVWVSEIDRMYGTKMVAGFTLYPGKAYLEVQVQLYNRTPEPQTFLWWANPAIAANDHTQAVFPPDVHMVFDHGRRDVSDFPLATGTYYKVDYSAGVDISRSKNIPVPTSYMAQASDYNFIGGYDHSAQAGLLHVANHHVSPGKKQWTWGTGHFGTAWERNLTDEDGPYIELMAGVYTDNQPDFSWLQPYEEKAFKQYFLPYKRIGIVKNATKDAALNLEVDQGSRLARVQVYATARFLNASIQLVGKTRVYVNETTTISPQELFTTEALLETQEQAEDLKVMVKNAQDELLVSYGPTRSKTIQPLEAAKPLPEPEKVSTNEALLFAGLHLEQYRHATVDPDQYYLEGLKRDPEDSRLHVAYGRLLLQRGFFEESASHFRLAIASLTRHNANPSDNEAYYQLGLALKMQDQLQEAFAAFYKATWDATWQGSSYFALAQIACAQHSYADALELVERALIRNTHNYQARGLQAALLRKLGRLAEAEALIEETLRLDIADFFAYNERSLLFLADGDVSRSLEATITLASFMRNDVHNFITLALDYSHCGLFSEAIDILQHAAANVSPPHPMVHYHLGHLFMQAGQKDLAREQQRLASASKPDYCFPNSLDDMLVLESALQTNPEDVLAHYYLGNLLYDKQRYTDAVMHWEQAALLNTTFATIHRNLALAYYNELNQPEKAQTALETAFALNPQDARVLYELDQLFKKRNCPPERRLAQLDKHWPLVTERDDLYVEYATLLNTLRQPERVLSLLANRLFHPWEGGEGKVTAQYILACVEQGKRHLHEGQPEEALDLFQQALTYPENLGEGKLAGAAENNIFYHIGCTYERLGQQAEALQAFRNATQGQTEPSNPMFYNDQPPDMIFYQGLAWLKLNNEEEARQRFHKLIRYGQQHVSDQVRIDYFAVSLPDFLVFKDDLEMRNQVHCLYMQGLGYLGLQDRVQAQIHLERVLEIDSNHQGASIYLAFMRD